MFYLFVGRYDANELPLFGGKQGSSRHYSGTAGAMVDCMLPRLSPLVRRYSNTLIWTAVLLLLGDRYGLTSDTIYSRSLLCYYISPEYAYFGDPPRERKVSDL
mmetsp:Transcript_28833/g.45434  ORF Transcript_28833/g.45434 Transcript_28833/m.45434 type:complete len:103 (+) Transcript_28833:426-734(+)